MERNSPNTIRFKFVNETYGMQHVCLRCNENFGCHSGLDCSDRRGKFLLAEDLYENENTDPNNLFIKSKKEF
jgi:hypothetical protein